VQGGRKRSGPVARTGGAVMTANPFRGVIVALVLTVALYLALAAACYLALAVETAVLQ
jgi:hypothetical protein